MNIKSILKGLKNKKGKSTPEDDVIDSEALEGEMQTDFIDGLQNLEEGEIPVSILVGFIPGAKKRDADSYVRGLMLKFCSDLEASGYSIQKFRGGYAYEIQEGPVLKSWLKTILKYLEANGRMVVPAGNRHIRLELDDTGIQCLMLRDNDPEMREAVIPAGAGTLSPYHNYVQKWVNTSIGLALFSLGLFMLALGTQKMLSENAAEKIVIETMSKTQSLPILYWPEVFEEDTYVAKLEFKDGKWHEPVFKSLNVQPEVLTEEVVILPVDELEPIEEGYVPPPSIPGFPDIRVENEVQEEIPVEVVDEYQEELQENMTQELAPGVTPTE